MKSNMHVHLYMTQQANEYNQSLEILRKSDVPGLKTSWPGDYYGQNQAVGKIQGIPEKLSENLERLTQAQKLFKEGTPCLWGENEDGSIVILEPSDREGHNGEWVVRCWDEVYPQRGYEDRKHYSPDYRNASDLFNEELNDPEVQEFPDFPVKAGEEWRPLQLEDWFHSGGEPNPANKNQRREWYYRYGLWLCVIYDLIKDQPKIIRSVEYM